MSSRGEPKERGFFRSIVSSIGSSSGSLRGTQSSTSTSSTGSSPVHESSRSLAKNHSFSGNLSFSRSSEDHANGAHQSILSKRPSLILPFHNNSSSSSSNNNSSSNSNQSSHHHHHGHDDSSQRYLEDFQAPIAKSGVLIKQANHFKTWKKRLMVLKGHSLFYYVSGTSGEDTYPRGVIPLLGVKITPIDSVRFKRQNCFEICHPGYRPVYLMAKSEADLNVWMSSLTSAAMPTTPDRKMLLLFGPVDHLFETPALEDAVPYKRTYYFRQKVAFALPRSDDSARSAPDLFELNEKRLTTLCDLNNYCDTFPMILADPQLYIELLHAIGCYIFRPFQPLQSTSPNNIFVEEPSADDAQLGDNPLDKYSEYTTEEQHWGLLSACYDLLLKAIEHIDKLEKHVRKDFFSLRFVAQLVNLFKTPSFRERQVLKGVLHRLYYKLTQRRSAIRKEIAHSFYEYIYESANHFGVAELLEILGSIVNGFACPIKHEHVVLLEKALIPLHSTPAFISYHQQLAYCMIQYVSKDHALFTPIVHGLLRYWPVGNSFKEVVFIVEFEELLEHVLAESDFDTIAHKLARRLGQCMVSDQFQVAERAISCWHSPACLRIMNEYEKVAQSMFNIIKPFLRRAMAEHWNVLIQQKAHETYTVYYNMGYDSDDINGTVAAAAGPAAAAMLPFGAAAAALESKIDSSAKTEESDPEEDSSSSAMSPPDVLMMMHEDAGGAANGGVMHVTSKDDDDTFDAN